MSEPEAPATLAELTARYAATRDPGVLGRLHRVVRDHPTFRADFDPVARAQPLLDAGAFQQVVDELTGQMPGGFLSPGAHAALGAAYEGLGDHVRAARERRTARLAIAALTGSGDGTAERPWKVLRISDEYAVLRTRGRRSLRQDLVSVAGRPLDRHLCDDGSQVWFDLGLPEVGAR